MICYQGALVADPVTGEWLLHQPIDVGIALEVIAAVKAEGFHMNVYLDDQLYVEELNDGGAAPMPRTPGWKPTPSAT